MSTLSKLNKSSGRHKHKARNRNNMYTIMMIHTKLAVRPYIIHPIIRIIFHWSSKTVKNNSRSIIFVSLPKFINLQIYWECNSSEWMPCQCFQEELLYFLCNQTERIHKEIPNVELLNGRFEKPL